MKVIINSAAFEGVCLRLDGTGVTHPIDAGGGVVNCQYGATATEVFELINNSDGSVSFQSTAFPNVFLRMDGRNPQAGGVVNAQYTCGPWEKFILVDQGNGKVSIKSAAFQNCWLYMDGGGINHPLPQGGGSVTVYQVSGITGGPLGTFTLTEVRSPIRNVFVLMLENRSFDNMFGQSGIPNIAHATTANSNTVNGVSYSVTSPAPVSLASDPGHEFQDVVAQLAGPSATYPSGGPYPAINNSGFASNYATSTTEGPVPPANRVGDIMSGFNTQTQLPVIYQLATEFALCDHWFASLPGPTWPNRFFVHGASSAGLDHSPTTMEMLQWDTVDGFSYPLGSIYDRLMSAGKTWRLYNDDTNAYTDHPDLGSTVGKVPQVAALKGISLSAVRSLTQFATDLQSDYSVEYTFIEPNYGNAMNGTYAGGSSQHPMDDVHGGEALVKAVYEAIRNSPVWNSSMLVITYDEHGGFYDSVAPGTAVPPNDGSPNTYSKFGFRFDRLGVRVPAVIVSPWIAKGVVDSTVYDHTSILATLEKLFNLNPLTARDAAANDLLHLIQSSARTDTPARLNNPVVPAARADGELAVAAIDDNMPVAQLGNLPGFLAICLKTQLELSSGAAAERQALIDRFASITTVGEAHAYVNEVWEKIEQHRAALAANV